MSRVESVESGRHSGVANIVEASTINNSIYTRRAVDVNIT